MRAPFHKFNETVRQQFVEVINQAVVMRLPFTNVCTARATVSAERRI
ncbi:hypothetical protein [Paenibacillus glacialis]|nr:hypothetical protein [Paenibacillus glacialis]